MNTAVFTPENIQKIRTLNQKLELEEKRISSFYPVLKKHLDQLIASKQIDDYNILTRLLIFSHDDDCNKRNNVEFGDPICETAIWSFRWFLEKDRAILEENWNERRNDPSYPLAKEHFCYTMHSLAFDSDMCWEDIVCIDDVWLEFKVDYQFFTNKDFVEELRDEE